MKIILIVERRPSPRVLRLILDAVPLRHDATASFIDWLWVRSPLEEMKYLLKVIFPFLRSGVEVKHGVEFYHSIRNASRIRQKV